MTALVTGGAGFIGSHLVEALIARGEDVVALDNFYRARRSAIPARCRLIEGDIRDERTVFEAVRGVDTVYHLAAQSNVMGAIADVDYSFTVNVAGTFNVLKQAARAGVPRVVFSSSREVYGEPRSLPVAETATTEPKNLYGASKVAGEAYCRAWQALGDVDVQVLRLANVYGPGDRDRVIPLWLARAAGNEPLELFGGRQVLDFIWIGVVVECLLAAASCPVSSPINVGSGRGIELVELARRVCAVTGSRSAIRLLPAREAEVVRFAADTCRMQEHLGVPPPSDPLAHLADTAERLL